MIARMNFEAILFDCDGVLVDSEAITCGVLRDMFEEQGWRSALATKTLQDMGMTNVAHIDGGFAAWKKAAAPIVTMEQHKAESAARKGA